MIDLFKYLKFFFARRFTFQKANSVYEIDYQSLKKEGIKLLIFDVDDTLCGHGDAFLPKSKKLIFSKDFQVTMISNAQKQRQEELTKLITGSSVLIEKSSNKPNPAGYLKLLGQAKVKPKQAVVIGDRLGTDLWGGHLAGITHLILVEPFSYVIGGKKAPVYIRLVRWVEKQWVGKESQKTEKN